MIRPNVNYHIKQCDIRPSSSDNSIIIIIVDTLSDDDIQIFPSVLIHISLRSLSLPYIRDLIQGQLIRCHWLGPYILEASTQLGFSSTEILRDPLVSHRCLSDYLAPHISDLATKLGFGRNCFSIVVKIITQSPLKYVVFLRIVQLGKMDREDMMRSRKMETESCSICLDNPSSGSKHGVPTHMSCSHIFHDGCLLEWFQRKNSCPCVRLCFMIHRWF
ncbi:unnamed protein product [Eruca vesicaria subsp. sativa]|uniref:RING-type E3 ubiquitin transferase n=1 Tax=Eruca vesicaria subsp. sativa TaxID=29727 RepID=A0ABC8M3D2_ERUVS|nr:unnamed protein product [Eruca vesicaria subsp. sativa]